MTRWIGVIFPIAALLFFLIGAYVLFRWIGGDPACTPVKGGVWICTAPATPPATP